MEIPIEAILIVSALVCILFPMVLVGIAGWTIGKKLGIKYPKYPWLRWVGLGLGLLIGLIAFTILFVSQSGCLLGCG